jgi:hypothetical protein
MGDIIGNIMGVIVFTATLVIACYHLIRRHSVAKYYKAMCFNLGTEKFWERYILIFAPITIIILVCIIKSILFG